MRKLMHSILRPQLRFLVRTQRTNKQPLPPPPVPPDGDNPHHLYVSADGGLASATLPFTSETGKIFVRLYGRNNAASAPTITATVNQTSGNKVLTKVLELGPSSVDSSVVAAFGGFITPNEAATLTFTLSGSMGRTWIRVGDFQDLPVDWADDVLYWDNLSGNGATDNYYVEIVPSQPAGSLMLSVVGWLDASAGDITSTGDYMQYVDSGGNGAAGSSVYYGMIDSPGGEPGWGGYVYYAQNGATRRPNGVVIAIPGATIPS